MKDRLITALFLLALLMLFNAMALAYIFKGLFKRS